MGFNLKTTLGNAKDAITQKGAALNEALYPGPNSVSGDRIGAFGGESSGLASDVATTVAKTFYSNKSQADAFTVAKGMIDPIPRSIFNRYALFNFRGFYGGLAGDISKHYQDAESYAFMGGDRSKNPSVAKIISFYDETYPRIAYTAQDFLYSKYYKKIPVNHLITLRRFPTPVTDNIFNYSIAEAGKDGLPDAANATDGTQIAGVTAVTYLGEKAGNKLEDILNFSYGLNWKPIESEMESVSSGDGGYTQQPFYKSMNGVGKATFDAFKGITPGQKFSRGLNGTDDKLGTTYANFVIGPVNVVKDSTIRDRGLKFGNDIKLNFEYELKSLNYVNPKIAMIDIISNMLTMSTNNAQFFGGGHRYYGSGGFVASQFGDISKLKSGDFSGYIGSVVSDVETGFKSVFGDGDGGFTLESLLEGGLQVGKTMLGNMLGGFLGENVGAISGTQATKAFISGEPTGDWHLTVGNPLNPIVTMGNMYCDNSVMTLGAGLGADDFPMEVKFEVDLKHGKPRDKGDIENMFNSGRGRIYAAAADEKDILNLRGSDTPLPYGAVSAGTVNIQQGSNSGAMAGGESNIKNGQLSNVKSSAETASIFTDNDAGAVTNFVDMMITS
tara:strand:+ start:2751 stop:4589 length:1839 start_codon:yes stop_codon:yes gene_type:complete